MKEENSDKDFILMYSSKAFHATKMTLSKFKEYYCSSIAFTPKHLD